MASFNIEFPEDFMSELLDTDFAEIAKEALAESVPILVTEMKKSCKTAIMHEGDSELAESITAQKPKPTKTDAWIVNACPIGNSEHYYYRKGSRKKRKHVVSNALKAIWKEYGIAGIQAPQPFLAKAKNAAEGAVIQKIQEVYNRKVGSE